MPLDPIDFSQRPPEADRLLVLRLTWRFVLHEDRAVKNITIKVDQEVARWARIWAAEHDTSVSRMLGEKLTEMMLADRRYKAAEARFLSLKPVVLRSSPDDPFPTRDVLHER